MADGGDERSQLSLLDSAEWADGPVGLAALRPLVRDPRFAHHLVDVTEDQVFYLTNRRNDVDSDVVARSLTDGSERVLYDGGGYTEGARVAPDGSKIAVTALSPRAVELLDRELAK